jgi:hypothetical protein
LREEGRDLSFSEAMELYDEQIDEECSLDLVLGVADEVEHEAAAMHAAHDVACQIYAQAAGDEEWAAQTMQGHPSEHVRLIGEAIESGDYAILAI